MTLEFRFRHLLVGILATYVLTIAIPADGVVAPLRVAVLGGVLVMAIRTRRAAGTSSLPVVLLTAALFIGTLVAAIAGTGTTLTIISQAATVLLVTTAIVVLIRTLISIGVVDGSTVYGVLCVYLLLALFFGSINDLFAAIVPHYLNGVSSPANSSETLYYSVITLTTVGYGDITPASNLARSVSATESLIGQLYLVSIVAAVVSRYQGRKNR